MTTARVVAGLTIFAAVIGACVIAEPAAELPTLPEQPPTIVRSSVVPSPNVVLTRWPETFNVRVRLTNPRATVRYSYFVDFNPATGDGWINTLPDEFQIGATQGEARLLEIAIPEQTPDRCHVIEIVVGLNISTTDGRSAHTPLAPGGDSVTWFYSPGGTLTGCPAQDSKLAPDAATLQSIDAGQL